MLAPGGSSGLVSRGWLSSTEQPEKPLQHWAFTNRLRDLLLITHLSLNVGSVAHNNLALKGSWTEEEMLQRRFLCSNSHFEPCFLYLGVFFS